MRDLRSNVNHNVMNEPLLSIHCLVYNHEPYLRQCLDGFVMQRTDFPFEAIVHDDCSTDNSAAIIREYAEKYPDIIKPIFEEENQYRKIGFSGIGRIMSANTHGKYIAVCEGDDYWIDPNKLQMQVDYLEEYPECGLVYTQAKVYNQETDEYTIGWAKQSDFDHAILTDSPIITLTSCYRRELIADYESVVSPCSTWMMSDYPTWLYIAYKSELKFIPAITAVYRDLVESASHSKDYEKKVSFSLSAYNVRIHFAKLFKRQHLIKEIRRYEVNDLFKLAVQYDKNLSFRILRFAWKESALSFWVLLKIILYSTSFGRSLYRKKYQ